MIGSLWRAERPFSYLRVISSGNFLTNHEQFSKLCKKAHISQPKPVKIKHNVWLLYPQLIHKGTL